MQSLEQTLPPSDGVRWFDRLYLNVTVAVRDYCGTGLDAPPFLQHLDIFFATQFFDAYDAGESGGRVPACWGPGGW